MEELLEGVKKEKLEIGILYACGNPHLSLSIDIYLPGWVVLRVFRFPLLNFQLHTYLPTTTAGGLRLSLETTFLKMENGNGKGQKWNEKRRRRRRREEIHLYNNSFSSHLFFLSLPPFETNQPYIYNYI